MSSQEKIKRLEKRVTELEGIVLLLSKNIGVEVPETRRTPLKVLIAASKEIEKKMEFEPDIENFNPGPQEPIEPEEPKKKRRWF